MTWQIVEAAGGLGLFLLGMVIMTEGLQGMAGHSLRSLLRRFTRSPLSGATTGALVTAVVQSSSVTTVSAIGFAGAGLLTFREAVGIVIGANVGTTLTGWMVALFGFKLNLGLLMPLAVLLGVLLRVIGRGRLANFGYALAGFGLIFIGIEALRAGMSGFEGIVTPERFPGDDLAGRAWLVAIGVLITLVTQSSSAGVATALVALGSDAINLTQAAAMVIGMDMGTTAKAAIATVGGSLSARRTGWAHVIFNVLTGVGAFLFLPVFFAALEWHSPGFGAREPQLALVGFHTCFNAVGVIAVLPFATPFCRLVERLVPDRPTPFTQRLDHDLLSDPEIALRAVAPTLAELSQQSLVGLRELLQPGGVPSRHRERLELLTLALDEVQRYLERMSPCPAGSPAESRRAAALHVLDQLRRLLHRQGQAERASRLTAVAELHARARQLDGVLSTSPGQLPDVEPRLAELRHELEAGRPGFRDAVVRGADPSDALVHMDAYRWLERVTHHAWRVVHHLGQLRREVPTALVSEPPEPD